MANRAKTAGERLRADLDAALARVAKERHGDSEALSWDERERFHLAAAEAAADDAERLAERLTDPDLDAATLVRLSSERRLLLKTAGEHVERLSIWGEIPKSEQHVRAGQSRMRSVK